MRLKSLEIHGFKTFPDRTKLTFHHGFTAVVGPNGDCITAEGTCEGNIAFELTGDGGFGYDPIFLVGEQSFAQLSDVEKDRISHRGKALMLFSQKLQKYLNNE